MLNRFGPEILAAAAISMQNPKTVSKAAAKAVASKSTSSQTLTPGFAEARAGGYQSVSDDVLLRELQQQMDIMRQQLASAHQEIQRLERLVDQDALLPVLNRRGFMRALERAIAYVERYEARAALIYIDLDGFKAVNDRFGHGIGDELLVQVSRVVSDHVRRSDMVARLGGDEFAILLWNADEKSTRDKAAQLCGKISEIVLDCPDGQSARVGASSGFTLLKDGDTGQQAIRRADKAMYRHKTQRKA